MCFRCDFDGGDCCEPDWYKDDYCDQRNNNEVCMEVECFFRQFKSFCIFFLDL